MDPSGFRQQVGVQEKASVRVCFVLMEKAGTTTFHLDGERFVFDAGQDIEPLRRAGDCVCDQLAAHARKRHPVAGISMGENHVATDYADLGIDLTQEFRMAGVVVSAGGVIGRGVIAHIGSIAFPGWPFTS